MLTLPSSVSSTQDLVGVTLEIREYAKWFSHNSIKHKVHAKRASLPPLMSPGATELIRMASAKKLLSQHDLDGLITNLEAFKRSAKPVTITLAAPPANDLKQTLVAWCRDNIAPDVLVSFKFSSGLLGGMVITYGSHAFDWSFRRSILAGREKFPEVLRSV